jgi:DNA-binding MarR family transcriptional regulator
VCAAPDGKEVTINELAQQLFIKHNSAVGLVDRLAKQGLLMRAPSRDDARKVSLRLTAKGSRVLGRLAGIHRDELDRVGPQLRELLRQITRATERNGT